MIIHGQKFKEAILAALADAEMLKIMNCVMYRHCSINEIIKETEIPHTTTYRKIRSMLENGLLIIEKIEIRNDGKKFSLFRSTLRSINVKYEHGQIAVEAEKNVDALEKTAERFFSLDQNSS
jgi:DNA-binding transcriptional ArsR family regulator